MANSDFKNAPPLHGWAIATAAGALMFGVSYVVIDVGANGAVAIGAVVALIIGVIFTVAERAPQGAPPAPKAEAPVAPAPTAPAPRAPDPAPAASAPATDTTPAASTAESAPAPAAAPAASDDVTPEKPQGLDAPVGEKDDLKRISGVGPVLEGKLNALGFYHFWQIAGWTRGEVGWVDSYLSFKGRIDRDDWIAQATKLAAESPAKPPA